MLRAFPGELLAVGWGQSLRHTDNPIGGQQWDFGMLHSSAMGAVEKRPCGGAGNKTEGSCQNEWTSRGWP